MILTPIKITLLNASKGRAASWAIAVEAVLKLKRSPSFYFLDVGFNRI
jgi:hypothetical protein